MTDWPGIALPLWQLDGAECSLIAQRENCVWRVDRDGVSYALRLHRGGYRTKAELHSELDWMAMLAAHGFAVPRPVRMSHDGFIASIEGRNLSLLTWLDGHPIGAVGSLETGLDPYQISHATGASMARLHDLTDRWQRPQNFIRPLWDRDGLLGNAPLWGRFWEHPHLSAAQHDQLGRIRQITRNALNDLRTADFGLIHADLLAENIMATPKGPAFIDFDDCAFGYRDFELATYLLKFMRQPYYEQMRTGLLDGYATRRPVDPDYLDLFLLLRALTYLGWIIDRLNEPGGVERSDRMLKQAFALAERFEKGRPQ
ncbi:MAG: phosphotransferase [Paracoccaceae bacterium]